MRRILKVVTFVILLASVSCMQLSSVTHTKTQIAAYKSDFLKAFSFTGWYDTALSEPEARNSLLALKETGTEYVVLCFFWFQDNTSSTVIAPDYDLYSVNTSDIIDFIDYIHSVGLKVVLKPMLDVKTGEWRAFIEPSEEWFQAYKNYMVFWAKIAQEHHVEMFVLGCELDGTITERDNWIDVISAVRNVYNGPLTYGVNFDRYNNVSFFNQLDFIGIDAYFPLTNKNEPSLEELKEGWSQYVPELEQLSMKYGKNILFVEIGYRSILGANKEPWNWQKKGIFNEYEQARCYEATFETFQNISWLKGFFWWNWEAIPEEDDKLDYTPHNKLAEQVLRHWYNDELLPDLEKNNQMPVFVWVSVIAAPIIMLTIYWARKKGFGQRRTKYQNQL